MPWPGWSPRSPASSSPSRRWPLRPAPRWRSSTPAGWAGRGRWIGSGNAWADARRSALLPPAANADGGAPGGGAWDRPPGGEATERVLFALVAQRACEPGSKLAATGWVAERVAIEGLAALSDDQAYRAMDFLLGALAEIAAEVFAAVAHLLNLDLDIVFVDTTSTYFEVEAADELAELQDDAAEDEQTNPAEDGSRRFGHSKDHR